MDEKKDNLEKLLYIYRSGEKCVEITKKLVDFFQKENVTEVEGIVSMLAVMASIIKSRPEEKEKMRKLLNFMLNEEDYD